MESQNNIKNMSYEDIKKMLISVISDIEAKSSELNCFAYPTTIKSILTASPYSPYSNSFIENKYYGYLKNLYTNDLIRNLELLCKNGDLEFYLYTNKKGFTKKRYKTIVTVSEDDIKLTEKELKEIDSIF